uniref:Origin recognition complex subunit 6 n=1 Tax=Caenorhabditis tropicalis TaxID=1561998 RepID=A0A1I7U8Y5_9PELO
MLSTKKAVAQAVSILGRSASLTDQLLLIKKSGTDREVKDLLRQCIITAMNYQSTDHKNLEKSMIIVRKNGGLCEISSRSAAFAAASAMKLKQWHNVDEMLASTSYCPPAIPMSIRIKALAEQSKLNEALTELEKVLMLEEEVFYSGNYSISDEALDALCEAIKSKPESSDTMKRFRNIQRAITKYERRTEKTIEDILLSPIRVECIETTTQSETVETFVKSDRFEEFVKKIPYLKEEKLEK